MKRVYYEKDTEEYLEYDAGRSDLLLYQEEMMSFVLPSDNEFLLKHLTSLARFIDDIYQALYDRELARERDENSARIFSVLYEEYDEEHEDDVARREAALDSLELATIADVVFQWHSDIMKRTETMTGLYAVSYFMSWAAYVRLFHLVVATNEERLPLYAYGSAYEHAYCVMVSKRVNVIVSKAPLIDYSIDDLWISMGLITTSLYTYAFSLPMRNYIYALFFRYADLLAAQQPEQAVDQILDNPRFMTTHDDMGSEEEEKEDNEAEEEEGRDDFHAYKKIRIQANQTYSIDNDFLYEGEVLFFPQLYRLQLSTDMMRHHAQEENAILIGYTQRFNRIDFVRLAMEQWCEALVAMTRDTHVKQQMIERYTGTRIDMHLYHGDRERHKRSFPTSACDARDVLLEARPLEMTRVNSSQAMVLGDLLLCFKRSYATALENLAPVYGDYDYEKVAVEKGDGAWMLLDYELEALLLTRICTRLFLEYQKVKRLTKFDDAFVLEELVSLQRVEEAIFLGDGATTTTKTWPVFLKLMRLYYVVDTVKKKVFRSLFFVEAYFVWLCLCVRQEVLTMSVIHPKLLDLVQKLNGLIQC